MTQTFEAHACRYCGTRTYYVSNGKCVQCVKTRGAARFAAYMERKGNAKVSLKDGFVRFGTLSHRILVHIHTNGPATHDDLVQDLQEVGISVMLKRLYDNALLYKVGRTSCKAGIRSGWVYSTRLEDCGLFRTRVTTQAERITKYRERKKNRVSSVFDFRGSIPMGDRA